MENKNTPSRSWKFFKNFFIFLTKIFKYLFFLAFFTFCFIFLAWWNSEKPSNLRDWEEQDAILPTISLSGNIVHIENIRNHSWQDDIHFTPNYFSGSYDINEVSGVDYIITPFASIVGPAHTMLSFSFNDGRRLVISAEIRKERWENFSALNGILNQYEIQYVIATEEDVIKLRTNYRKNDVILYPIKIEKDYIKSIFRSMIIRSQKLAAEPEFYNTLFNNCTTTIWKHANALRKDKIKWTHYLILPEYSDKIIFDEGLIDTALSLEEARKFFNISEKARNIIEWENFSEKIREF